ncbi:MAG TPA: DUF2848 family protein [Paenalcaligenes sp.]|nr:DUF2848 family protein [Paenalcaligenes sp.]
MQLKFQLINNDNTPETLAVGIEYLIVTDWARRAAGSRGGSYERSELRLARARQNPKFYPVANNQLTQSERVQVVGPHSTGAAEVLLFKQNHELFVSLVSDHTDRALEVHNSALSKQVCIKPIARAAWRYADVADHWDELEMRAWLVNEGHPDLYQEGSLSSLLPPLELVKHHFGTDELPNNTAITCGTVTTVGRIRTAPTFVMELYDPRLERNLRHEYFIETLPLVD